MTAEKVKSSPKAPRERKVTIRVSEANINKAAIRLIDRKLVSTEVHYVQRVLGNSATQADVDTKVVEVRRLPWASIVEPE
jgi:hypothetical protein